MEEIARFGIGFICGGFFALAWLRHFDKKFPDIRTTVYGGVPFVKKEKPKRKPVIHDELKEYQKEQERLKGGP